MFNLFFNLKNGNTKLNLYKFNKNVNFKLKHSILKKKVDYFNFFIKDGLFIQNNTNKFLHKDLSFKSNKNLIYYIYKKIGFNTKLKNFTIRSIFAVILNNSTLWLKNKLTYWLKWISISKHRRFVNTIVNITYSIFFQLHLIEYKTQLFLNVKGKLGIRGNNKKKKNIYPFATNLKNFNDSYYLQDGKGSSSNHGHTFFKIRYKVN